MSTVFFFFLEILVYDFLFFMSLKSEVSVTQWKKKVFCSFIW